MDDRIAGVSPACGCTQPLMSEVYISSAFLFAYRQIAGETPALHWSRLHFRIAGISSVFLPRFKSVKACRPKTRKAKVNENASANSLNIQYCQLQKIHFKYA
ncbi:MAG: hypothetical protein LBP59_15485, partial [Planctomycetaceae bacterium]|nr:hypothetical protein [Planctomycetaceae bacterium]